jgi:hypothetical protein
MTDIHNVEEVILLWATHLMKIALMEANRGGRHQTYLVSSKGQSKPSEPITM